MQLEGSGDNPVYTAEDKDTSITIDYDLDGGDYAQI